MEKITLSKSEYIFSPSTNTMRVLAYKEFFNKENLLLITNVSTQEIIYNFGCKGFGGTISGSALTFELDVSEMSSDDNLQVVLYIDTNSDNQSKNMSRVIDSLTNIEHILSKIEIHLSEGSQLKL